MARKKIKNIEKAFNFLVPHIGTEHGNVPWQLPKPTDTILNTGYDFIAKRYKSAPIVWTNNTPFKAALKFKTVRSSRSSVQMILKNTETGVEYFMRETDFEAFMPNSTWVFGVCIGEWKYKSYGGYCSLVPADVNF